MPFSRLNTNFEIRRTAGVTWVLGRYQGLIGSIKIRTLVASWSIRNLLALFIFAFCPLGVAAQQFPLTIDHKFGTTVIDKAPVRIATVDYAGADDVLAFGFQPLTSRTWFGPYDDSIWPWAQSRLTTPVEVLTGELNFEQIAATNPDVILAIRSGITDQEYNQLSQIAPVVAVPKGVGDYELTWDQRAGIIGQVLDKQDEAAQMVEGIQAKLTQVKQAHPDWSNNTFAMATFYDGSIGVYSGDDTSVALISQMGLNVVSAIKEITVNGEFYINLSAEKLQILDADVLFWYADPNAMTQIQALDLYPFLNASQTGREIILPTTSLRNGALSFGSLLSLPVAIDLLVPAIEAAVDGDTTTKVPYDE